MTRTAFGSSQKTHALDFKLRADKEIQFRVRRDDVPPRDAGRSAADTELAADFVKDFRRKKSYLAFVVLFEIEETVARDAASSHAMDFRALNQRVFARRLALTAKEIMAGRNVEVADFHGGNMTIISGGENLFTCPRQPPASILARASLM
jgi:hypothetical protein